MNCNSWLTKKGFVGEVPTPKNFEQRGEVFCSRSLGNPTLDAQEALEWIFSNFQKEKRLLENCGKIQFQTDFVVAPHRFTLQKHSTHRHCFNSDCDQSKSWLTTFEFHFLKNWNGSPCRPKFANKIKHKQSCLRSKFLERNFEPLPQKNHTERKTPHNQKRPWFPKISQTNIQILGTPRLFLGWSPTNGRRDKIFSMMWICVSF